MHPSSRDIMSHSALSTLLGQADLARIDRLITETAQSHDVQTDLLVEHLQSARVYLLGAMPDEYEFSLMAAENVAAELSNTSMRDAMTRELAALLDHVSAAQRRQGSTFGESGGQIGKSELYRFFHGAPTTFGVFYPTHYIFASFHVFQDAKNAAHALQAAGYGRVIASSAAETLRFMNEIRGDVGLWGAMMASISRFFGTEEVFADKDLAEARIGAGFLAAYCPRQEEADHIRDLVAPFDPLTMQLYLPDGIQTLIAGKSPGPQGTHPEEV
jgi:hypothetical protein